MSESHKKQGLRIPAARTSVLCRTIIVLRLKHVHEMLLVVVVVVVVMLYLTSHVTSVGFLVHVCSRQVIIAVKSVAWNDRLQHRRSQDFLRGGGTFLLRKS